MAYTDYDTIGTGYDGTRQADAYLLGRLWDLLALPAGARVLDVGCGTGNYTSALQVLGLSMTGVEPSERMLAEARTKDPEVAWVTGSAEALPVADGSFHGAIATLTTHHWTDLEQGFREVQRALLPGSPFVLFLATPEQTGRYWLSHYFPDAIARSCEVLPSVPTTRSALERAGFRIAAEEPYSIRPTLQDLFLYSAREEPQRYLDEGFRKGISTFAALTGSDELNTGLQLLRADIDSGGWQKVRDRHRHEDGDYLFLKAMADGGR